METFTQQEAESRCEIGKIEKMNVRFFYVC